MKILAIITIALIAIIAWPIVTSIFEPREETIVELGTIIEINGVSGGGFAGSIKCIVTTEQKQIVLTGSTICSSMETGKRICHVEWRQGSLVGEYYDFCDEGEKE